MTIDPATLPPADVEQLHLAAEISDPAFVDAVQHEFADRCGECGQPVPPKEAGQ